MEFISCIRLLDSQTSEQLDSHLGEGACNPAVSKSVNHRVVLFFAIPSLGVNHFRYSDFQFFILGFWFGFWFGFFFFLSFLRADCKFTYQ